MPFDIVPATCVVAPRTFKILRWDVIFLRPLAVMSPVMSIEILPLSKVLLVASFTRKRRLVLPKMFTSPMLALALVE